MTNWPERPAASRRQVRALDVAITLAMVAFAVILVALWVWAGG